MKYNRMGFFLTLVHCTNPNPNPEERGVTRPFNKICLSTDEFTILHKWK